MKLVHIFILIPALILIPACNNTRAMANKRVKTEIHFGRTGGFTNIPVEYSINSNGEVFRMTANEPDTVNHIPVRKLKSIIRELKDIDFQHIELNNPGNISYFIKVMTPEYENIVRWNDLTPNDTLKNIYRKLLTTLKPDQ